LGGFFPQAAQRFRRNVSGETMSYTLGAAARATGKSKATIHRAIQSGRLSATRTPTGGWSIDASELARVFPETAGTGSATVPLRQTATVGETANGFDGTALETAALKLLISEQAETIRDLRSRLDGAAELQRATLALLTDRRTRSPGFLWWRRWARS
jgi:hypothetical protein